MMGKVFWITLAALVVVGTGAYLIFGSGDADLGNGNGTAATTTGGSNNVDDVDNAASGSDTDDNGATTTADYVPYSNAALGFSILRPADAEVAGEGPGRIKFTYLGPGNPPNSEITNGFTLTMSRDSIAGTTTLRQYAESRVTEVRGQGSTILTGLELRNVAGTMAYRYSFLNMLGSTTWEYAFLPGTGRGYVASYTIADPNGEGYQDRVFTMLESIAFSQD